jgi:PAS domain S-box-containing protein
MEGHVFKSAVKRQERLDSLSRSSPKLRFVMPVLAALFILTLVAGFGLVWRLQSEVSGSVGDPIVADVELTWILLGGLAGLLAVTIWLLWTNSRERDALLDERKAYIQQQLAAFDNAHDPIIVVDELGQIENVNVAAERLFGQGRADLRRQDFSRLFEIDASDDADFLARLRISKDELAAGVTRELWGYSDNGARFPVEAAMRAMAGGDSRRIVIIARDMSERREAQEALRKSERQFRLLINGVTDHSLFMIDPDGLVTSWNDGAARLFGYGADEVVGGSFERFHLEEEIAEHLPRRSLAEAKEQGRFEGLGWRVRKDGSRFWADVVLETIHDDDGNLLGFAKIVRDISERKRVEQLKDEFVSTVNHELRTPLTSIAGSLGLLEGGAGGELPAGAARLIAIAHANCQRLIRLINDMLDVEKIESGKMQFEMTHQSLADVVNRSVEAMSHYTHKSEIRIEVAVSEGSEVRGDLDRLIQVVTNLVSNAVKFSPPSGRVHVSVTPLDRLVRLCVADDGPGIPAEFCSRIFTKFAQADSSDTRQKGGTGLGLVIAKDIVERHGGQLWFESEAGHGARFYVDLPRVSSAVVQTDAAAENTVLLCEDDADIAAILTQILEREGVVVETAQTIAQARAALAEPHRYRALLLDLILPDGDGISLIRSLRARKETQELPVIVVSAEAERGRESAGAGALNVVDWMDKPVELERLRRAVHAALGPTPMRRPVVLHVEDDHDILQVTASALSGCGEIVPVDSLAAARAFLARRTPDLIILDIGLGDGSGLDLLPELGAGAQTLIPVVIFSVQDSPGILLPQIKAVLVKSKTSLNQLAQTVQQLLDRARPITERKIAV